MDARKFWLGCDPGGIGKFGVSKLFDDGNHECYTFSSVSEVLENLLQEPLGVGIDCPMWWSKGKGGGRQADQWIRDEYKCSGGEVQPVNSLRGAAVVQGILLAMEIRKLYPHARITESHPKPLLKHFKIVKEVNAVQTVSINNQFNLNGNFKNEHERDATLCAIAAREGYSLRWTKNLATDCGPLELDPRNMWFGSVDYWWP